jgi:hypothetical protein
MIVDHQRQQGYFTVPAEVGNQLGHRGSSRKDLRGRKAEDGEVGKTGVRVIVANPCVPVPQREAPSIRKSEGPHAHTTTDVVRPCPEGLYQAPTVFGEGRSVDIHHLNVAEMGGLGPNATVPSLAPAAVQKILDLGREAPPEEGHLRTTHRTEDAGPW